MAPSEMQALALGDRGLLMRLLRAVTGNGFSCGGALRTVPTPQISDTEVLVKVKAIACNPTDVAHMDFVGPPHSIIGCDYSGIVEQVGPKAVNGFKPGDRIAGVVHGGLFPDKGAFAEYLKVEPDLAWKPPAQLNDQQAATYGISALTAMQGLYTKLDVPWPGEPTQTSAKSATILIYAASTAASLFAIQIAKLAGLTVVATCSPHNFDLVKRYGADAVYDYHSPTALNEIKTAYPHIDRAFDGISLGGSTLFCAKVVESNKGKVVILLDTRSSVKGKEVDIIWIMMYTLLGHPFALLWPVGPSFPAVPSDREALVRFYSLLPNLTESLKPPPMQELAGGFDGLLDGLEMLRAKKVSGQKLVARL